jgi:3-isopropylmalate/(R)-2-methylmalate dehydratase small subunit
MKAFGGPAIRLDRNDINTDEIIPAFAPTPAALAKTRVVVARANFGCGSSREHAVWAFEVNDINVIIAESFARIFRQNMFNCGILAVELGKEQIDALFALPGNISVKVDLEKGVLTASSDPQGQKNIDCAFTLNSFDKQLVAVGGWLPYADRKY